MVQRPWRPRMTDYNTDMDSFEKQVITTYNNYYNNNNTTSTAAIPTTAAATVPSPFRHDDLPAWQCCDLSSCAQLCQPVYCGTSQVNITHLKHLNMYVKTILSSNCFTYHDMNVYLPAISANKHLAYMYCLYACVPEGERSTNSFCCLSPVGWGLFGPWQHKKTLWHKSATINERLNMKMLSKYHANFYVISSVVCSF